MVGAPGGSVLLHWQAFVRSVHGQWDGAYALQIDMGPFALGEHYWLEGLVLVSHVQGIGQG